MNLDLISCWVAILVAILWLWLVNDDTNAILVLLHVHDGLMLLMKSIMY
jgi:hypothetical protein